MALCLQRKLLLSISILISNRPDTVGKCLKSLDSLRRRVPSELILVDTGCGEEVRKIIEPYGDKIVEFEWCNDFSKARNEGLKHAKGEWFLYLDDDEWFEDTEEIEDFFLSDKHLHYNCGSYFQRNYFDQEGSKYRDEYVGRLIRLEPGVEFVYSIHEGFSKVREPRIRLHSYVHHYGYAFKNEEEAIKHSRRNIGLLLQEHEKNPGELRHNAQLVQEYNALKEWDKSTEISLEGIRSAGPGVSTEQFLGGLYVNAVRNYMTLGQHPEAIELGEKYLVLARSNELAKAAVRYHLCIAYLEIGEYAESLKAVDGYLNFHERWEKNRDATAFYEALTVPFMSAGCEQAALCIGVQAGSRLGYSVLARKYFDKIDWIAIRNILVTQSVRGMVQALFRAWICTDAAAAQDYTAMMRVLLKDGVMAGQVLAELESLQKDMPEFLQTKKADWAALAEENWAFLYYKLKNGVETDRDILIRDYGRLWKEPTEPLLREKELGLWEIARRDRMDMGQILSAIPIYRWEEAVGTALETRDWEDIEELQEHLKEALDEDSFHMLYWSISYRIRRIWRMTEEQELEKEKGISASTEEIVRELLSYAAENESLCRRLYREEVFRETPDLLPRDCRASLLLSDMARAAEESDFERALNDIKGALEIMPELSDALKCCAGWISEQSASRNREQDAAREEMRKLADAVKLQVHSLAAQGMLPEALGVLRQLMELMPGDEEGKLLEKDLLGRMA